METAHIIQVVIIGIGHIALIRYFIKQLKAK